MPGSDQQRFSLKIAEFLNMDEFNKLTYRQQVGWFGQQVAKQYLLRRGFEILAENYYVAGGEIDIAVRKEGVVRLIEVKTRTGSSRGQPQEAINFLKLERLLVAAQKFMLDKNWLGRYPYQVDGLAVLVDKSSKKVKLSYFENILSN